MEKKLSSDGHAAPHRGFNEKAREMLLDRKSPGAGQACFVVLTIFIENILIKIHQNAVFLLIFIDFFCNSAEYKHTQFVRINQT